MTEEEEKREKSFLWTSFVLDMVKYSLMFTVGVYAACYMAAKVFIEFAPQVCAMIKVEQTTPPAANTLQNNFPVLK